VKTEFNRFSGILDKTQKKLQEASHTIEDAARKSRTIERKLKDVQALPQEEAAPLLEPSLATSEGVVLAAIEDFVEEEDAIA